MTTLLLVLALAQGKVEWAPNYDDGLKTAKEFGKPVMLVFGADW